MNDVFDLDQIGRTFEIDNCNIDTSLFAKLTGVDLAQGRDATCASVIFQKPYQVQRKHHKKKRINKKWAKRYGYVTKFKTYHMEDVHIEQNEGALSFTGQKILGY